MHDQVNCGFCLAHASTSVTRMSVTRIITSLRIVTQVAGVVNKLHTH